MSDQLIPFPRTNGSNGSAQVRVVLYPVGARVIVEHDDHTLDAWDQVVRLIPLRREPDQPHFFAGHPGR
jgi:hypothetical protein